MGLWDSIKSGIGNAWHSTSNAVKSAWHHIEPSVTRATGFMGDVGDIASEAGFGSVGNLLHTPGDVWNDVKGVAGDVGHFANKVDTLLDTKGDTPTQGGINGIWGDIKKRKRPAQEAYRSAKQVHRSFSGAVKGLQERWASRKSKKHGFQEWNKSKRFGKYGSPGAYISHPALNPANQLGPRL